MTGHIEISSFSSMCRSPSSTSRTGTKLCFAKTALLMREHNHLKFCVICTRLYNAGVADHYAACALVH
jgi:hypothetical protein